MLVFFTNLSLMGISGQIFGLISFFLSNRQLRVVLDGKSSQEYPVKAGFPQGSILGPTLFLLYVNDTDIYTDDTTLYCKCDQASDLWQQQLELASELEFDLRDIVDWGKKWLADFSDCNYGSLLEGKSSFKMLGLTFSSKLDWGSYIISIAKTVSKKIGALIRSVKFLSLRLLGISINLP